MNASSANETSGSIEIICGCMFSGKTAHLIDRLQRARHAAKRVLAFKHVLDRRYAPTELATHDGRRYPARSVADADSILAAAGAADVIGIDEGQFFGDALVSASERLRGNGRRVIISGIDYNVWGRPFEPMPRLKALADSVEALHVPCTQCGQPARYSQRMVPVIDNQWVGGPGEYEPRCERCFVPLDRGIPHVD